MDTLQLFSQLESLSVGCANHLMVHPFREMLAISRPVNKEGKFIELEEKLEYDKGGLFK